MALTNNGSNELFAPTKEMESTVNNQGEIMTHAQMLLALRILMYGVTPAVSVVGVVGNIFSIIILTKHGLNKSSNILLISLALADLSYLIGFNSIPKILYEVVGLEYVWEYSQAGSIALFVFYNIFNILDNAMGCTTFTMPMLITTERLIAVFIPLKFNIIVTPFRTWFAVTMVYSFWLSYIIYMQFWFTLTYSSNNEYNITVGRLERTQLYKDNPESVESLTLFTDYAVMKVPPVFTLTGCIVISFKVKMASIQRKKMKHVDSKKDVSTNRTTKVLLAVCVVYIITSAIMSIPNYFPQIMSYTILNDVPTHFGRVMYQVVNTVLCINSSSNFLVYVVMNKNFRDTYKSLFKNCHKKAPKL